MDLKTIFLPWLVIEDLRAECEALAGLLERETERTDRQLATICTLRASISQFDHDGDGRPGGSKKSAPTS